MCSEDVELIVKNTDIIMNILNFHTIIGGNYDYTKMPKELRTKLERLATLIGCTEQKKLYITSHYRTPEQNVKCKGSPTSSHLNGSAVDILCPSPSSKFLLLRTALSVGFCRIGIYDGHIHLDVDLNKTQNVVWLGKSN